MNRLAVLIPVYDNQWGLERTLQSLRAARGDFDVVVVDDGSKTCITVPLFLREAVPVRLLRMNRNRGIAGALNCGLAYLLANGYQHVGRIDAGDSVAADRFEQQVAFLDAHPECGVVASFVDFVDVDQRLLFRCRPPCEDWQIRRQLHLNNCLIHPAATIRMAVFRELGFYCEDVAGAEDYELFLRLSKKYTLAVLPEVLTFAEYAPSGLSLSGRHRQHWSRLSLQLRYFDPLSSFSFLGVVRTLLAMMAPQSTVYRFKRAYMH